MKITQLKVLRMLAPGTIVLLCGLPLYFRLIRESSEVSSWLIPVATVAIGALYYATDSRGKIWRPFLEKCRANVRSKLVKSLSAEPGVPASCVTMTDHEMMRVFYHIIDNDNSLTRQAEVIMMNGAVLTTLIDAMLILPFFGAAYLVAFGLTARVPYGLFASAAFFLAALSALLEDRVAKRHIQLEDEQLSVIAQLHHKQLRDMLSQPSQGPDSG